MWAPANYPNQIRPLPLSAPGVPRYEHRDIPCGVPSCAPIVQRELLKAVREQMPSVYNHAAQEIGLTVSRAEELIQRRIEIVSSARAIRLARLIALEPNSHAVFGEAGFDVAEATCELAVRVAQRGLGIELQMPRYVRHDEQQIAELLFDLALEFQGDIR